MREIISKKTGHIDFVDDVQWGWLVANGKDRLYTMTEVIERKLKPVPVIKPPEIKTTTKKK